MDALGDLLDSVLSDPEKLSQLATVAENLGLAPPAQQREVPAHEAGNGTQLLSSFLQMAEQAKQDPRQVQLLSALRPFLRPERRQALDRAVRAAQLSSLAALLLRSVNDDPLKETQGV